VGTGVEQDDAALRSILDGAPHALPVEALGLSGEVWVCGMGQVDVAEDLGVVGPCWRGEVDGALGAGAVELGEEEST